MVVGRGNEGKLNVQSTISAVTYSNLVADGDATHTFNFVQHSFPVLAFREHNLYIFAVDRDQCSNAALGDPRPAPRWL